ncbi:arylesterase precursor [Nonlabens marinus S1-08]|uniref:Arylesterase n=2 Tax=Nonlabens TaxID=363408 RepID=W8VRL3_9FLAO|nr:arylesterase precursor [Nonlabens marinus S1-08]
MVAVALISCKNNPETPSTAVESGTYTTENENSTASSNATILFFGDSITAGYGLDDTNDAFPGIIQTKIDSLGWNYEVVNSGLSGETTAGGRSRIEWILNQEIDVFVLELGANDGLRGVPLSETRGNLQAIIDAVKTKSPQTKIVLAGMQLPPNMGQAYTNEFKSIFIELAEQNDIALIPFILENVGGIASLNQADGIHPNVEGHKIVAENVWDVLKDVIEPES